MAQLDEGGFVVMQDNGAGQSKISAYIHVQELDLRNKIEHWVLVVQAMTGETPFHVPQVSVTSTNATIVRGDGSHQFDSVAEFLDARYHDAVNANYARRYIKCACADLTL